jgi:hypothetical protein
MSASAVAAPLGLGEPREEAHERRARQAAAKASERLAPRQSTSKSFRKLVELIWHGVLLSSGT